MLASDRALSLLVAMESALDDSRYEVLLLLLLLQPAAKVMLPYLLTMLCFVYQGSQEMKRVHVAAGGRTLPRLVLEADFPAQTART